MSYVQRFGLSRKSPLNKSYRQKLKDGDIEPSESDKKWGYTGPDGKVTGTEYTDPNSEYNTVGAGKDRGTWDPKGGSDGKGGYTKSAFSDEELETAKKISNVKRKIKEVSTGKVGKEVKEGFDPDGNPSVTKRKDGTYVYGDQVVDAPKSGQTYKTGMDEIQTGIDFASMIDPTGFVADGLNASISGIRGVGALAQGDYEQAKKFGKAGLTSTFFMIPGTDIGKVGKFNKMLSKGGKTRYVSKTGKYKQPIFQGESKFANVARGLGNFSLRKGKDTKLNKNIASLFGDSFVGKKVAENTTSVKGIKNYSQLTDNDTKEKKS